MSTATTAQAESESTRRTLDRLVRLGFVGTLFLWCAYILAPFLIPVVWGVILAVSLRPVHERLAKSLGGREKSAAVLMTVFAIAVLVIPAGALTISAVESGLTFAKSVQDETLQVPAPPEGIEDLPLIGESLHETWTLANENVEEALVQWKDEIKVVAGKLVSVMTSLLMEVVLFVVSFLLAGVFLATTESGYGMMQKLGRRLSPMHGPELVDLATATTRSVAKGVIGIAVIQALAAGIGMLIAGVPAAGIWSLGVLIVAIIQLPPLLILGPVAAWYFTAAGTGPAVLLAVWLLIVSFADTFLKPLLLGRGLSVPMPVILLGAIGGMLASGIIGLFAGAVVLALGHALFVQWLEVGPEDDAVDGVGDGAGAVSP
ncbi:MAG: AI-2E family transporter [Planctomycetota bacterium]